MRKQYLLPNGKYTASTKVYAAAWRKLARPIEKVTSSKCWAFDPNLAFSSINEDTGRQYTWYLGASEAAKIGEALKKVKG